MTKKESTLIGEGDQLEILSLLAYQTGKKCAVATKLSHRRTYSKISLMMLSPKALRSPTIPMCATPQILTFRSGQSSTD